MPRGYPSAPGEGRSPFWGMHPDGVHPDGLHPDVAGWAQDMTKPDP